MFEVGVYEAKTNLSKVLRRVKRGEECVITERGQPIARMKAVRRKKKDIKKAWKEIIDYSKKHPINATLEEMIAWKNEGRP